MKNNLFIIAICFAMTLSCNSGNQDSDHIHQEDSSHVHEAEDEHSNEASAVSIDYESEEITKGTFHFVTRVSGTILPDKKGEISILATSPGILSFSDQLIYPGIKVTRGSRLFSISGANLTEDNPEIKYKQVVADYNKARENYDRAKRLRTDNLITEEHYLSARNEFEKAEAQYSIYNASDGPGHRIIKAPANCFIKEVFVKEGEYVRAGDKLLSVQTDANLILRADLPPGYFSIRSGIRSAKFTTGYTDQVYSTEDMNGRLISYGRAGSDDSYYIPVFFKIDFTEELIPGTFADIWLIGEEIKDAIVISNSAIMEEFGRFYVFIDHGDHFDKRFIEPGKSDGQYTQVLSGLEISEVIVSRGTYQVKMSMMSSIPNTHNHSH